MRKMFSESAQRIWSRLQREQSPHVVYLQKEDNSLRTKPMASPRANELFKSPKHYVLGVYDQRCPLEWIDDDLTWLDRLFATS